MDNPAQFDTAVVSKGTCGVQSTRKRQLRYRMEKLRSTLSEQSASDLEGIEVGG